MAPLAPDSTRRYWFDYVTGDQATSQEHTLMVRTDESETNNLFVQEAVAALLTAIGAANFRQGWRVLRIRRAAQAQVFSVPVAVQAPLAAFVGTNISSYPANREAEEWTFQGRSTTTGRRVDLSLYGISAAFSVNFRYPAGGGSPSWVQAAVTALQANDNRTFIAIDGTEPTWYSYVNCNYNSYWERRIRTV